MQVFVCLFLVPTTRGGTRGKSQGTAPGQLLASR